MKEVVAVFNYEKPSLAATEILWWNQPVFSAKRHIPFHLHDWNMTPIEYSKEYRMYLKSCKSFATWATEIKKQNWVKASLAPSMALAGML